MTLRITSIESLESAIAEVVRLKLDHASLVAKVEAEKIAIEKQYAPRLSAKTNTIAERESEIQAYCIAHRIELFPDKKSLETRTAVVGFSETPPRVDKPRKLTWDNVLARMRQLPWARKYIRPGVDSVDKESLLGDRKQITVDQQRQLGITFAQDEQFYIRPKSDIVEATVAQAA